MIPGGVKNGTSTCNEAQHSSLHLSKSSRFQMPDGTTKLAVRWRGAKSSPQEPQSEPRRQQRHEGNKKLKMGGLEKREQKAGGETWAPQQAFVFLDKGTKGQTQTLEDKSLQDEPDRHTRQEAQQTSHMHGQPNSGVPSARGSGAH